MHKRDVLRNEMSLETKGVRRLEILNLIFQNRAAASSITALALGIVVVVWASAMLWPLNRVIVASFPVDITQFLVAAKAMANGSAIYKDILTPIGPLFFYPLSYGERVFHSGALSFNLEAFASAFLCIALSMAISFRRLTILSAAVLVSVSTLIVLQPFNIGESYHALSFVEEYSKQGWALALICFVLIGLEMPGGRWNSKFERIWDLFLLLIGITLCFYIKITYFVVVVVAALMAFLVRIGKYKWDLPVGALIATLILFLLPINKLYIHNIILVFDAGYTRTNIYEYLSKIVHNIYLFPLAILATLFSWSFSKRTLINHVAMFAIAIVGSFALLTQNAQWRLMPSAAALFIILYEWSINEVVTGIRAAPVAEDVRRNWGITITAVLLLIAYPVTIIVNGYVGFFLYRSIQHKYGHLRGVNLGFATNGIYVTRADSRVFLQQKLYELYNDNGGLLKSNPDIMVSNPSAYFATLMNAKRLLRENHINTGTIFTFDSVDGLSLVDGMSAPKGAPVAYVYKAHLMDSANLFRNTLFVAVPTIPEHPSTFVRLSSLYGSFVSSNFHVVGKSLYWTICKRNVPDHVRRPHPCVAPIRNADRLRAFSAMQ